MTFQRFRRLRSSAPLRNMIADTHFDLHQLVMPLFVVEGTGIKKPIASLSGHHHFSPDKLLEEAAELDALGIKSLLLFGIPDTKDPSGSRAWDDNGPVPTALRLVKQHLPHMILIADVCLCEYTSTGHCGVCENQQVQNDATLELLSKAALCYAKAGADIIAPSDMMDGRIGHIRKTLDDHQFHQLPIMSYSSKYASSYYGPFREAAGSAPEFGDRRGYQMDFRRSYEALDKAYADLDEGADIIMIKPGLAYLDVLYKVRQAINAPMAVYNVSGEFAMVKAAAAQSLINERLLVEENMHSFVRAGANIIITYHAKDLAVWRKHE